MPVSSACCTPTTESYYTFCMKFLVSLLLVVVMVIPVFSQTYSHMELWVDRIPISKEGIATCEKQRVLLYVDPQRLGIVTVTDTLALIVLKELKPTRLHCQDLVTGDEFIYEGHVAKDGFIFFVTPLKPRKSKYSLIYSTIPCSL